MERSQIEMENMANQYDRSQLIQLIKSHALQFGNFTLASGKQASFYLDCRKLTLHPLGANQVGAGMLALLDGSMPNAIGGMAIGADPITAATITLAGQRGLDLLGFIVRKEAKQHGAGRQVEGPIQSGMSAVVVEDVVTSGGSALKAVDAARQFGLQIDRILAIVDRLEGGREAIEAAGLQLDTLVTVSDLGI
ncbi:MAG: orotate phosphoribosyltransferase [Planctomycetales bacterium]|nr:orotate phosphoribosyltransferase [Planctomycetales bacterium]